MRRDLNWFFHYCLEKDLLSAEQVHGSLQSIHGQTSLEDVGDILTQAGWIDNPESIRDIIKSARKQTKKSAEAPPLPSLESADPRSTAPDFSAWTDLPDEELSGSIRSWIAECQASAVSDIHLTADARPRVRHHREVVYLSENPLEADLVERIVLCLLSDEQKSRFQQEWELDFVLDLEEREDGTQLRLRANLLRHINGVSAVFHMAHTEVASLEELGFPNAENIRKLLTYHNGIVLVTGPIGSGKTTTLASLVHELNETRKCHIVAIEDPIEVVQASRGSILTQREVGTHVQAFDLALKSALREDPDVIVVGELRDLETIEMAVTAAETGHLVIGTLHTRDAASTLNRILNVFPPRQQSQIRAMTADSLRGIICQRLIPSTDGGVALACEFMVNTSATANLIREGKDGGIGASMQTGKRQGMRTMDESILELYKVGRISRETAENFLQDPGLIEEDS